MTVFGRNLFCCEMRSTACTWSSVACSSAQNAVAARRRWSEVIRFQRRAGVSVVSVIVTMLF